MNYLSFIVIIHCVQKKVEINPDMLSKYCSDVANKYGTKVGGVNKLVPTLRDKNVLFITEIYSCI